MSNLAAVRVIKKFRLDQTTRLQHHLRRWGPLSKETTPALPPNSQTKVFPNPFIAHKLSSGKWRPPLYSLRRQAELVKAAKANGLVHLLPPSPKTLPLLRATPHKSTFAEEKEIGTVERLKKELERHGDKNFKWLEPVAWEGKMKRKGPGVTLYARKKRMFKGHRWERVQEDRKRKQAVLLRDMKKRIYNYKNFHRRRRPNPLKPPRTSKARKLPF